MPGRLANFVRRKIFGHGVPLSLVSGPERTSGQPLNIACGVVDQNRAYLLALAFAGKPEERGLGILRDRDMVRDRFAIAGPAAFVTTESAVSAPRPPGTFFIPVWVRGAVDLPLPDDAPARAGRRSDLRKMARFDYIVTRDGAMFDHFYHRMYVPYVTALHGDSAFVVPYEEKRAGFESCELLLVRRKDEERFLAGLLISYADADPRIWSLGVLDGSRDHVREGAVVAADQFSFRHLEQQGFRVVDMGGCRAFLNDGVLRYKRRLSQRIVRPSDNGILLKVLSLTPAARAFLRANPFIFEKRGRLCGAVFLAGAAAVTPEALTLLRADYAHLGMAKLFVAYFDGEADTARPRLPPPEGMEILSVDALLARLPHVAGP